MIKFFNRTTDRDKEEEKKAEENPNEIVVAKGKKKSPGEIRLKKEITELDLPAHARVNIPDESNIMKFEVFVDLTNEECLWKGGKYKFTVIVDPNYPH